MQTSHGFILSPERAFILPLLQEAKLKGLPSWSDFYERLEISGRAGTRPTSLDQCCFRSKGYSLGVKKAVVHCCGTQHMPGKSTCQASCS